MRKGRDEERAPREPIDGGGHKCDQGGACEAGAQASYWENRGVCATRSSRGSRTRRSMARSGALWLLVSLAACSRSQAGATGPPAASPIRSTAMASLTDDWPERYRGKPMLVIIENYALSIIGALPPEKEDAVRQIVKRNFGGDDDWRATLRRTMAWPSNVDSEI